MGRQLRRLARLWLPLVFAVAAMGVLWVLAATAGEQPVVARPPDIGMEPWTVAWPLALEQAAGDASTAAAVVAALQPSQVSTLSLSLGLHSRQVSGLTPRPEVISFTLRRAGQELAGATALPLPVPAPGAGYLYVARLPTFRPEVIWPGDVLEAVQAGSTVSVTVPTLTVWADGPTATVFGQAPSAATLEVFFYRYSDTAAFRQTVTVTVSGDYSVTFAGLTPVTARDYGYVFHADPAGNAVYARYNVPYLELNLSDRYGLRGVVAPRVMVTTTLYDSNGVPRGQVLGGLADSDGVFKPPYAMTYVPRVGDTYVVTAGLQVLSLTVPMLTVRADAGVDVVSGQASPGGVVNVDLYPAREEAERCMPSEPAGAHLTLSAIPSADGHYAVDFAGLADLTTGSHGVVAEADAAGHRILRRFAVPFVQARLGAYLVAGQLGRFAGPNDPLTITVRNQGGIVRDMRGITTLGYYYDYDDCFTDSMGGLTLRAGDRIVVTDRDGQEMTLTLPRLTAAADWTQNIVSGQAPANASLRVGLMTNQAPPPPVPTPRPTSTPWPSTANARALAESDSSPTQPGMTAYPYNVTVTSTAGGDYTASFEGLVKMGPGDYGAVFYNAAAGHRAFLEFSAAMVRGRIGSNLVTGVLPTTAITGQVTLRNAAGQAKATAVVERLYSSSSAFTVYLANSAPDSGPVVIEVSDSIELTAGTDRITAVVPVLTADVDRLGDVIAGQTAADAALAITWTAADAWVFPRSRTWDVVAAADGAYRLDLAGQVNLERGDHIEVIYSVSGGGQVSRDLYVPDLVAELGDNWVTVRGAANAPLVFQVLNPVGTPIYTATGSLNPIGERYLQLYTGVPPDWSVWLAAGQTFSATLAGERLDLTLPRLTALADPSADTVTGEAPPGTRLVIESESYAPKGYYYTPVWLAVTATQTGTYTADFAGQVDIRPGRGGRVYYLHPDGYRVRLPYASPYVAVTIGSSRVSGRMATPGSLTVELYDRAGNLKGLGNTRTSDSTFTLVLTDARGQAVAVTSGDMLAVKGVGQATTFTVPVLTALLDHRTGVVAGTAPADALLRISMYSDLGYVRQTQACADGTYAQDWSDLSWLFARLPTGQVSYTDATGNQTVATFEVLERHRRYLPTVMAEWLR